MNNSVKHNFRRRGCLKKDSNSDDNQQQQQQEKTRKSVEFDKIEVREFPIILGDNPTTTEGIPLTIDWEPQRKRKVELEYFELYIRQPPKTLDELRLDKGKRIDLALAGGCSFEQMVNTGLLMAHIQKQRAKSSQKRYWELIRERLRNQQKEPHFTKIPNEAPIVLAKWAGRHTAAHRQYSNAAA